jgi:hypothetical protein
MKIPPYFRDIIILKASGNNQEFVTITPPIN